MPRIEKENKKESINPEQEKPVEVAEVEINLALLNKKLNYVMAQNDLIIQKLETFQKG